MSKIKSFVIILGFLLLGLSISYLVLAWTEPGSLPPGGNVSAPVNVGGTTQYKSGALGIGGVFTTYNATYLATLSGNVGIGITNPSRRLDVSTGSIAFGTDITESTEKGLYWQNSSNYGIYRTAGAWSAPNYQQLKLNWITGIILNPGSGYGKSYVDIQGSGALRLQPVASAPIATNGVMYYNSTSNKFLCYQGGAWTDCIGAGGGIGGSGTDNYIPRWNGANALENSVIYQSDTGNVGIGTTSPGEKLEVAGRIKVGNIRISGAEEGISLGIRPTDGISSGLAINGNPLRLNWDAPANSSTYFTRGAGVTAMFLDGSTGNVGIGTAPSQLLHVNGIAQAATFYASTGVSTFDTSVAAGGDIEATRFCLGNGINCITRWPAGGGTPGGSNTYVQYNNSGAFGGDAGFTYSAGGNDLYLGGSGSQAGNFYLKDSGGTIRTQINSDGTSVIRPALNANLRIRPHADWGAFTGVALDSLTDDALTVMPMRIRGTPITLDGNVGIGTTTPGKKLDVNGAIRTTYGHFISSVPFVLNTAATGGGFYFRSNPTAGEESGFTDLMTLNTAGRLDVASDAYVAGQRVCRADGTGCPARTKVICSASANDPSCTATCPAGYDVTGGGINFTASGDTIIYQGSYPSADNHSWICAINRTGTSMASLTCLAICQVPEF